MECNVMEITGVVTINQFDGELLAAGTGPNVVQHAGHDLPISAIGWIPRLPPLTGRRPTDGQEKPGSPRSVSASAAQVKYS
jgi:hypothetical protein